MNSNVVHSFFSKERNGIEIDGVSDVVSFDEAGVVMDTSAGSMAVEGEGLHITVLNITDGKVTVEGRINGVYYFENRKEPKRGFFGKKND